MKIRNDFLPYNKPSIGEEEINEVVDTLKNGWITMGPKTSEFEKQIADYIGVKHAISLNSCTAGLHLSLIVLGIGKGDEVICPTYTFASSANVIVHVGAKPVFVDIEEDSFNISPEKIEQAITSKTKAIMVVHYSGYSADMDRITEIAQKHNLKIIEDAAHAIGSEYANKKKIGSSGNLTSFSFYATKNITTGEGGALVTNDDKIADKLRILRLHGMSRDAWKRYGKGGSWYYEIEDCGWKYNMTDIQAAIGIHQLKKLDSFIRKRREYAKIYDKQLTKIKGIKIPIEKNSLHPYHLYSILIENYDRNKFIDELTKRNIGTSVHFIPLHLHPFYRRTFGYKEGDFPVAERVYRKEVSLPLYPGMSREDVEYVVSAIKDILLKNKNIVLRPVDSTDCRYLYEWRIHPVARANSRNTGEISYEEHKKWFSDSLKNPDRKMYMALDNNLRVGQIRFDKEAEKAKVSITVSPEKYGQGYGSELVKKGSEKYLLEAPEVKVLCAEIRPSNKPSLRVFEKAGYKKVQDKGEWIEFWFTRF